MPTRREALRPSDGQPQVCWTAQPIRVGGCHPPCRRHRCRSRLPSFGGNGEWSRAPASANGRSPHWLLLPGRSRRCGFFWITPWNRAKGRECPRPSPCPRPPNPPCFAPCRLHRLQKRVYQPYGPGHFANQCRSGPHPWPT